MKRLGGVALVLATIVIAFAITREADDHVSTLALDDACGAILPGDAVEDVFARLGLDGYRPGCSTERPCPRRNFGELLDVPYLCDGDDCSLYWRTGDVGCLVDWPGGSEGVTGATLLALPR